MLRIIPFVHKVIEENINEYSTVVDATTGNGNDTLFLSKIVTKGKIYGFDIQSKAIENTKKLVQANNLELIKDSHEFIDKYVDNTDLVLFNLGYLPNSDKKITTTYTSTINAINQSLKILNKGGIVILVLYPGHPEGKIESEKVQEYAVNLTNSYDVSKYEVLNKNNAPYVIIIKKKKAI